MTRRTRSDGTGWREPFRAPRRPRGVRRTHALAAAVGLLLLVSACAQQGAGARSAPTTSSPPPLPTSADSLVLRVAEVGGLMGPAWSRAEVPLLSVYADGRAISEGPIPMLYPGPALPNLQQQHLDAATVQELVGAALAAGVAESTDLGRPPVADAGTTRFTVVTRSRTYVREVYALGQADSSGSGLTTEQQAARTKLQNLRQRLDGIAYRSGLDQPYEARAVAVLARPWTDPQDHLNHPPATWPGPALPGQPMGTRPGTGCAIATGAQAQAVLDAASRANMLTPWRTPDGARWGVGFRPLLPDESGCADLN